MNCEEGVVFPHKNVLTDTYSRPTYSILQDIIFHNASIVIGTVHTTEFQK